MDKELLLQLSTTEFVPALVREGACICWPANIIRVPIPLIDFRWVEERLFAWATIQTPFGSDEPLFGLARYASQQRMECLGSAFYAGNGAQVCAIVANEGFGFPSYTVEKLRKKAHDHFQRLSTDKGYAGRWAERWHHGIAQCFQDGQPS